MRCPEFGQDRVNFHRIPGRGTAGEWGWPHLAKQSPVFHTMCCHAGFRWGGAARRELTCGLWGRGAGPVRESGCLGRAVRCCVFSLFVPLLFLFPSVCCSVKLPLSRPTGFCLFLSILLRTPVGGGAAAWRFCCRLQPKPRHARSLVKHIC